MDVNLQLYDRDGTKRGDLSNVEVKDLKLNLGGAHEVSVEIPWDHPLLPAIDLGRSEIGVFLDEQTDPTFHGPIWDRSGKGSARGLTYKGLSLESHLYSRFIEADLDYVDVDQHTIAWNLLQHTQAQTDGDLRITSGFSPSGKLRTRHWHADEFPNIFDRMDSFREINDGFDWDIVVFGDGRREFQCWYPKRGTNKPSDVLEWGKNIVDFKFKEDGRTSNDVVALGGGEGPSRLSQRYTDAALRAEYGLRTKVLPADIDVSVPATLLDRAQETVQREGVSQLLFSVTVKDHEDVPLLSIEPGDELPVRIERADLSITGTYLITSVKINPYENTASLGVENV